MTGLPTLLHTRLLAHRAPDFSFGFGFSAPFITGFEGAGRATETSDQRVGSDSTPPPTDVHTSTPTLPTTTTVPTSSSSSASSRAPSLPPSSAPPFPSVSSTRTQIPSNTLPTTTSQPTALQDSAGSTSEDSQSLTASAFTQTQTVTQVNDPIITSAPQKSLGGGAIAGIAVGTTLLAALLVVFLVLLYLRRRHRQEGSGKPEHLFTGGGKSGDGDKFPSDPWDIPPLNIEDTFPSPTLSPSSDASDRATIAHSIMINPASTLEKPESRGHIRPPQELPIGAVGGTQRANGRLTHSPLRIHETDGGVRLAGGRPGSETGLLYDDEDAPSDDAGATLPPPYSEVRY
ncbi:hypothetical protein C8Q74DRAFT_980833 [Fomes fomentarius]|nr:hypothetical protein C8Q74DRAFT_980833 [Fomes fomentarius]